MALSFGTYFTGREHHPKARRDEDGRPDPHPQGSNRHRNTAQQLPQMRRAKPNLPTGIPCCTCRGLHLETFEKDSQTLVALVDKHGTPTLWMDQATWEAIRRKTPLVASHTVTTHKPLESSILTQPPKIARKPFLDAIRRSTAPLRFNWNSSTHQFDPCPETNAP